MARLMSAGCDERASFSADGSGLSLNFWWHAVSSCAGATVRVAAYLVQYLAVLIEARVDGLEVFLSRLQRLLDGVVELGERRGRRVRVCSRD
jgi:hypothetical protein